MLDKKIKVVTHMGPAHADEIMAIALVMVRRGAEMDDMDIMRVREYDCAMAEADGVDYVIDVGKQHDPTRGFFDHHQFDKDAFPDCAFSLIARHFGYTDDDFPWMRKMAFVDSKGPYAWFRECHGRKHSSEREVKDFLGDGDSVFIYFARVCNRVVASTIQFKQGLAMAESWLAMEIEWLSNRKTNVEYARKNLRLVDCGSFKVAFFDQKDSKGTLEVCDELSAADGSVIVTGKLDDRGDGFSAMRLSDNPRVDFKPRDGEPDCVFAHSSGFCLKWKNNWDTYLEAVKRSVDQG